MLNRSKNPATWSLFVRLTHWVVAACVVVNFFNDTGYMHRIIGYVCLIIVGLRIGYGFRKKTVKSAQFYLPRLSLIKQHIAEIRQGHVAQQQGHNPLGILAVYLIWLLIALLALTGWISRTDAYWGEDGPVVLHEVLSYLLQGVVLLHLSAVLIMSKLQKQNLIKAMILKKSHPK